MSNLDNLKTMLQGMHAGVAPSDGAVAEVLRGGVQQVDDATIATLTGKARADLTDDDKAGVVLTVTRQRFVGEIVGGIQNAELADASAQAQAAAQQAAADLS